MCVSEGVGGESRKVWREDNLKSTENGMTKPPDTRNRRSPLRVRSAAKSLMQSDDIGSIIFLKIIINYYSINPLPELPEPHVDAQQSERVGRV